MSAAVLKQTTAIIAPDPFSGTRHHMSVPAGLTISQLVAQAIANDNLPPRWSMHYFRIYVGGEEVPSAWWGRTRLKAGSHVAIVTAPQGGGNTGKVFKTLALVAVIALTAWVGGGLLAGAFGTSLFAAGSVSAALAAAGVSLVGGVIINALSPPPGAGASASQAFSLQGAQNAARPNQPYPVVLGRRRVVPPLAAATWTETIGDDVYLRMLLAWHTGPCTISDIKIGETPIGQYDGVEMLHRLMPGDPFPEIYNQIVREQPLQLLLSHAVGWVQQATQRKTTSISIDFGFPTGLNSGGNGNSTVAVKVQYRATGSDPWINAPVGAGGVVTYTENKNVPFRRNINWDVPEGQYDIQIQRQTADNDSTSVADDIYWVALRSLAAGLPVKQDNLAITALRIKSSAQLNGVLDNLNGMVQMYAPKWDAGTGTFTGLGATRNPGEIANWIATGPANARPLTDRVDIAQLGAWAERCTEKGWNCDHIIDNGGTVETALQVAAGCGRGFGAMWFDGKLAVAVDDEQPAPVQVFSARNVKNFTGTIAFPGPLHAVNVNFTDEDNGFQASTRTVFAEGYDDSNATLFETIDATGKTNAAEAWIVGWRYLAARTLRPEVYEFDTNMQGLCVRIGQRADVAHYRMSVGICGARIRGLIKNGDGDVTGFRLDETVTMETGKTYALKAQSGSVIRLLTLATVAGTSNTVMLPGPLDVDDAPEAGDHCVFGIAGTETLPAIVIGIAPKAGKDGHLTAIPYAPGLLADGGTIPDWDPLITPRVLHGTVIGVHVPGADRVTNDNVIKAINQERHDRAVGDSTPITIERFAEGITPVQIVVDLDDAEVYEGATAVLTGTGELWRYHDGEWTKAVKSVDITGQLTDEQIADLDAAKITGQIVSDQISDASLTVAKFATNIAPPTIETSEPTTGNYEGRLIVLGGKLYRYHAGAFTAEVPTVDLTGTITGSQIAAATVDTTNIVNGAITAVKTALAAISAATGNLNPNTVGTSNIVAGAVTSALIASATITATQLANNAVGAAQIAAAAVTAAKTSLAAIDSASGNLTANSVGATQIVANSITAAKIAAGTITASEISAGAIGTTALAANAVTAAKIAAGTITATEIASATIVGGNIAAATIAAGNIVAGTITGTQIAATTITGAKIAAGTITGSNIAANTVTTGLIAAGAVTANQIAAAAITASKLFIGDASNMILNTDFSDFSYWDVSAGASVLTGSSVLDLIPATSALIMQSGNGTTAQASSYSQTPHIPIEPGKTYRFGLDIGSLPGYTGQNYMQIFWFDYSDAVISSDFTGGANYTTVAKADYHTDVVDTLIVAPARATSCQMRIWQFWSTTQNNALFSACANPRMQLAADGTLIVDGSIIATKIAAATITGSKIAASTITASNIAASTITATEIAGATITGTKIAAGTITSSNLSANSVTAGAIAAGAINASTIIVSNIIVTGHLTANSVTSASVAVGGVTNLTTVDQVVASLTVTLGNNSVLATISDTVTWTSSGPIVNYTLKQGANTYWFGAVGGGSCPDNLIMAASTLCSAGLGAGGTYTFQLLARYSSSANVKSNNAVLQITDLKR